MQMLGKKSLNSSSITNVDPLAGDHLDEQGKPIRYQRMLGERGSDDEMSNKKCCNKTKELDKDPM